MPLQWRNQIWQSLEEGAGKRCSECAQHSHIRVPPAEIIALPSDLSSDKRDAAPTCLPEEKCPERRSLSLRHTARSTWTLRRARVRRKEMISTCRIFKWRSTEAWCVDHPLRLLANRVLSLKSQRCFHYDTSEGASLTLTTRPVTNNEGGKYGILRATAITKR